MAEKERINNLNLNSLGGEAIVLKNLTKVSCPFRVTPTLVGAIPLMNRADYCQHLALTLGFLNVI